MLRARGISVGEGDSVNQPQQPNIAPSYGGGQPSVMPAYAGGQTPQTGNIPQGGQGQVGQQFNPYANPNGGFGGNGVGGMNPMGRQDRYNYNQGQGQEYRGANTPQSELGYTDQFGNPIDFNKGRRWANNEGALPWNPETDTRSENNWNQSRYLMDNYNANPNQGQPYGPRSDRGYTDERMNQAWDQFGGQRPYQVGQNQGANEAYDMLMGGRNGAPTPERPQTNYQGPNAPTGRDPQYDSMNFNGFDRNQVQGPQTGQIRDPNREFAGPNGDYSGGTASNPRIGRETIGGSGFAGNELFGNPNSVAGRGYNAALAANEDLARGEGFGVDAQTLAETRKQIFAEAGEAGRNIGLSKGSNPAGGSVASREIGKAIAPAAAQAAREEQQLALQAAEGRSRQRIGGAQGLTDTAGSAGQSAVDRAKLLQGESQYQGDAQQNQRGQDITQRGQDLNAASQGASQRTADYQAQTQRMTGMNSLMLQADEARQNGNIQGYNAATQRLQTEYGYNIDQARNQIDGYQAATQRGEVGARAFQEAQNLGFDYAGLQQKYQQMGADNLLRFNDQMLNAFSGDTERLNVLQNGFQNLAQLDQQGQIEAGRQAIQYGGLMADMIQNGANATQAANELAQRANEGDRDAFIELYTFIQDQDWQRDMYEREQRGEGFFEGINAGDVAGMVTGAVAAWPSGGGRNSGPPSAPPSGPR